MTPHPARRGLYHHRETDSSTFLSMSATPEGRMTLAGVSTGTEITTLKGATTLASPLELATARVMTPLEEVTPYAMGGAALADVLLHVQCAVDPNAITTPQRPLLRQSGSTSTTYCGQKYRGFDECHFCATTLSAPCFITKLDTTSMPCISLSLRAKKT
jgi:hypothetical protein